MMDTRSTPPFSRRTPSGRRPRLAMDSREQSFPRLDFRRLNGGNGRGCGPQ